MIGKPALIPKNDHFTFDLRHPVHKDSPVLIVEAPPAVDRTLGIGQPPAAACFRNFRRLISLQWELASIRSFFFFTMELAYRGSGVLCQSPASYSPLGFIPGLRMGAVILKIRT